jgi:FkbM family methyltransferase
MFKLSRKIKAIMAKIKLHVVVFFAKNSDLIIDCGANVGKYTRTFARKNRVVYAFEPNPYAFNVLSSLFKTYPRVHCINKAVSTSNGRIPLYLHNNTREDNVKWSVASSIFSDKGNVSKGISVDVETVHLLDFIKSLNCEIYLLKMDIEGAEYDIILELIKGGVINKIKYLFVETHANRVKSLEGKHSELVSLIRDNKIHNISLDWE